MLVTSHESLRRRQGRGLRRCFLALDRNRAVLEQGHDGPIAAATAALSVPRTPAVSGTPPAPVVLHHDASDVPSCTSSFRRSRSWPPSALIDSQYVLSDMEGLRAGGRCAPGGGGGLVGLALRHVLHDERR